MIARIAGLFLMCMLTMGAAMVPAEVTPASELQAASRQARDGDLQGDWNKQLDARRRVEHLVQHHDIAALVDYQLGYVEWQIRKNFWWVSRVAMPQARRPALTTFNDPPARARSVLVRVRMSFVVSEWLEAVWAAIRSVFEYGNAWSRALLSSHG